MTDFWSKRQVRTRLGFRTDAELARFFGISRSAVSQWPGISRFLRYVNTSCISDTPTCPCNSGNTARTGVSYAAFCRMQHRMGHLQSMLSNIESSMGTGLTIDDA